MATETVIGEPNDQFPIGMRVLAVDDDPTSLFLLETMLRLCHYNVTTTGQAMAALKLLRENKNMFDLVISDVHMPDIDGFKLLEFVGLEMDLPVIMMSVDGDTKLVMKGITHGACDYLVKPVRMEELRNIWQHVVRRKKQFDRKDRDDSGCQDKLRIDSDEAARMGDGVDQKRKLNKKRKDQEEEEEDDQGRVENLQNYQDPISTQKKPRVIWSRELHCNFVAAVNQLGIDKAVPKKILELMNEKNLTRENVASHLQKFRLFLKRLSADQQASLAAASLGNADSSYLKMGSHLNVLVNFHNLARSNQCHNNAAFTSFPPSNVHGRLRAPAELGMHGLPSAAGMTQSGRAQNWGTTSNVQSKQQSFVIPGNYEANNTQQGILPMPLEVDEPQSGKIVPHISQLSTTDFSTFFSVSGSLIDARMTASTDNPLLGVTSSSLILEGSSSNQVSQPGLQSQEWNGPYHSNAVSCSMNSFPNSAADGPMVQLGQCLDRNSSNFQRSMDLDETGPPNFVAPFP